MRSTRSEFYVIKLKDCFVAQGNLKPDFLKVEKGSDQKRLARETAAPDSFSMLNRSLYNTANVSPPGDRLRS
jgi:hypothetical protein